MEGSGIYLTQMTHTTINHNQGAVVVEDLDAPFDEDLCVFTTNRVEAKCGSLKRWMRKRNGGKLPPTDAWNPHIREYQWRKYLGKPYFPTLIDSLARVYEEAAANIAAADREAAEEYLQARRNRIIDLDSDDDM